MSGSQLALQEVVDSPSCADPLLDWLPDETLFSLVSRLHRHWGYAGSWQSAQLLFGKPRAGTQHDFPCGLDQFVLSTAGAFGTGEQLSRERTLLRFYRPFRSAADVQAAVASMRSPAVAHLKFRLGLLTSRFRANHPLKACASCMREDVERYGWSYWHMRHQYPGVWICLEHRASLHSATVKSTGVERFLWHLPDIDRMVCEWDAGSGESFSALYSLAGFTTDLIERDEGDGWLDAPAVQTALRLELGRRGWLTAGGNARLTDAAADYLRHCLPLRVVPEFLGLPSDLEQAKAQLGRVIRPLRSGVHPLRLLVAMNWLFDDAQAFVISIDRLLAGTDATPTSARGSMVKAAGEKSDEQRTAFLSLLRSGRSASGAAAQVGITVVTAMAWAAAAGIPVGRRPKALKAGSLRSLIHELRKGADKQEVANRFGVSVQTVTRVLRTEVGLHESWQASRARRTRSTSRAAWRRLLKTHRGVGVKLLREINPAAYSWLYRNDRAWLHQNAPVPTAKSSRRKSIVAWDERDEALSKAVQRTALRLKQQQPTRQLRLWHIYQALPELKPKLSALERLPLTQRALDHVLCRRQEAAADLFE